MRRLSSTPSANLAPLSYRFDPQHVGKSMSMSHMRSGASKTRLFDKNDPGTLLLYYQDSDFKNESLQASLLALPLGVTMIDPLMDRTVAIDFLRSELFNPIEMHAIAVDLDGDDNDLNDKLDGCVKRCVAERDAGSLVFAFGMMNSSPKLIFTRVEDLFDHSPLVSDIDGSLFFRHDLLFSM